MMIIMRLEMQKMRGHDYHEDCWTVHGYHDDCWTILITVIIRVSVVINIIVIIIVVITVSLCTFIFYTIHFKCGVREHW